MLSVPSGVLDLIETGRFNLRYMLWVDLPDGATGIWNDTYPLTYSGVVYAPLAGNMNFSGIPGSSGLASEKLDIEITHLLPAVTTIIAEMEWMQRPAVLMLAIVDAAGVIQWVIPRFSGFLDEVEISDAVDDLVKVKITIESNNRELSRINGDVRSDASQRRRLGTDRFYDQIASSNADVNIYWGRKGVQQPKKKSFWSKIFG